MQLDISVELADQASAEATLKEADVCLQAAGGPADQDVASEASVDTALAKRDSAAAALNRIKALIAQKAILAPFAGRLGIRHVELGQYVSAGLSMVTLQAQDPIWVDFPMPEQNIGKLKRDQVIELTVDAYPGQVFKGKYPRSMRASRRIPARCSCAALSIIRSASCCRACSRTCPSLRAPRARSSRFRAPPSPTVSMAIASTW